MVLGLSCHRVTAPAPEPGDQLRVNCGTVLTISRWFTTVPTGYLLMLQSPPVYVNAIEPAEKEQGDLWYEVTDILKVYVNGALISINPDSGTITPGPNSQTIRQISGMIQVPTNSMFGWYSMG